MKKIYLLLTLLLIVVSSCKKEDDTTNKILDGEQEVEMKFIPPLTRSTRAGEQVEERIEQLDLLVFKNGEYQYCRQAYSSAYAVFRAVLKIEDDIDIYFFANSAEVIQTFQQNGTLAEGVSRAALLPKLILKQPSIEVDGKAALPMWGELTGIDIKDDVINNLGSIDLIRTVAAAEVVFTVPEEIFNFTKVYLYHPASESFMVPDASVYDPSALLVTGAYCPADMVTGAPYDRSDAITGQSVFNAIYMFDNDADKAKDRSRTRLVVGGSYKGAPNETYYPLDFLKTDENKVQTILDVVRNSKYILQVTAVNGQGWETPDEAAEAAAVNMDYKVIDWNTSVDEDIIIDGPDYLSIKKRSVTLYKQAGSTRSLSMSTSVPVERIQMSFAQNAGTNIVNGEGVVTGIRNEHYKAELVFDGNNSITDIKFTANLPYDAGYASEKLLLTVGRISLTVTIERVNTGENDWNNGGNNEIEF